MTREEAITVLKAFTENPLFSDEHKQAFNIAIHDIKQRHDWDVNNLILINKDNYEPLEQEPTTKNDLAVDAVSREAVNELVSSQRLDTFSDEGRKWANIKIDVILRGLKELPSVTPQEPRKGKWTKILNTVPCMNCPICGSTFTLIQGGDKMHYCPNCGAKMVEPQESEDKE